MEEEPAIEVTVEESTVKETVEEEPAVEATVRESTVKETVEEEPATVGEPAVEVTVEEQAVEVADEEEPVFKEPNIEKLVVKEANSTIKEHEHEELLAITDEATSKKYSIESVIENIPDAEKLIIVQEKTPEKSIVELSSSEEANDKKTVNEETNYEESTYKELPVVEKHTIVEEKMKPVVEVSSSEESAFGKVSKQELTIIEPVTDEAFTEKSVAEEPYRKIAFGGLSLEETEEAFGSEEAVSELHNENVETNSIEIKKKNAEKISLIEGNTGSTVVKVPYFKKSKLLREVKKPY